MADNLETHAEEGAGQPLVLVDLDIVVVIDGVAHDEGGSSVETGANVALGGGYGYNFVFGQRSQWLLHLSVLPSLVVYKHNRLTVNGDEMKDHGLCFNMLFNERVAVVYHFTEPLLETACPFSFCRQFVFIS